MTPPPLLKPARRSAARRLIVGAQAAWRRRPRTSGDPHKPGDVDLLNTWVGFGPWQRFEQRATIPYAHFRHRHSFGMQAFAVIEK